jgi:prophage regulatory protein
MKRRAALQKPSRRRTRQKPAVSRGRVLQAPVSDHGTRLLRLPVVSDHMGMARATLYRDIARGLFPPPIKISMHAVGWPEREVAQMTAALIRGENERAIRALVKRLTSARDTYAEELLTFPS